MAHPVIQIDGQFGPCIRLKMEKRSWIYFFVIGMKSKAGKKFDAYLIMNQEGKTTFEFGNEASER